MTATYKVNKLLWCVICYYCYCIVSRGQTAYFYRAFIPRFILKAITPLRENRGLHGHAGLASMKNSVVAT